MQLGSYKRKVIRSGQRYAIAFNGDGRILFEDATEFYAFWKKDCIGTSMIFSQLVAKYATISKIVWRKNSAKVTIPEHYRKLLGLVKGSSVELEFFEEEGKTGFCLNVI
jgi:hypothetical protein